MAINLKIIFIHLQNYSKKTSNQTSIYIKYFKINEIKGPIILSADKPIFLITLILIKKNPNHVLSTKS
jgi:hypothetical protein